MHRMTPNWTWTLNSQKYFIYMNTYPWGSNFAPFQSLASGFEDIAHFIIIVCSFRDDIIWNFYPIWSHVHENGTKMTKIQNLKFHNSLNSFGRDPPQEYAWFLARESGAYFQRRCCLKFLLLYGPMLTKTKKNHKKIKNLKFWKTKKKWSGDMVDRYLSVKFGVNPLDGFRENDVYGRMDGRMPAWRQ